MDFGLASSHHATKHERSFNEHHLTLTEHPIGNSRMRPGAIGCSSEGHHGGRRSQRFLRRVSLCKILHHLSIPDVEWLFEEILW